MLIVLDNAADIDQVTPLLPGSPTCTVLITSRRHLAGLTRHGARLLDLDILPESDARDLLARHLGAERLAAEPEAAAELLTVCAGLPLALAIVAALAQRHPTFRLAVLVEELRDASTRLDGLNAGDLHVNLRAAVSYSVRTLSPQAASLFGLLGIAPGPDISLPAAASLAGQPVGQVRAVLRELEHASLAQQHVPGRYRMHDLIRLYATGTAHHNFARPVQEAALRRVLDFYTHMARTCARLITPQNPPILLDSPAPGVYLQPLPDFSAALAWLDAEHTAMLAAHHTAARHGWHPVVWEMAWTLDTFYARRGYRHDRLAVCRAALNAAAHLLDPIPRIIVHRTIGGVYTALGRPEDGIGHLHQALDLAEEHHEVYQQARTHRGLAFAWARRGDYRRALQHATRALGLFRALDQPVGEADSLSSMGWYAARLGEHNTAHSYCQIALTMHRQHHVPYGEAHTLDGLGYIAHHTGRHQQAIVYYQQALDLFRAVSLADSANTLDSLGHPHLALGEHEHTRAAWQEALQLYQQQGRDADADRIQQQLDYLDKKDNANHQQPPARNSAAGLPHSLSAN